MISEHPLHRAYCETAYAAWDETARAVARIGACSVEFDALLRRTAARSAVFVTAWNPRSEPRPDAENAAASVALRAELAAAGRRTLEARAIPDSPGWPPEDGLLVLDMPGAAALALALRYGQNAIVQMALGRPAQLLPTPLMPLG